MQPKSTALVLIEYQNDFTTEGGTLHGAVKPVMDSTGMLGNTVATAAVERTAGAGGDGSKITYNVIKARLADLLYKITSQKFEDPSEGEEAIKCAPPASNMLPSASRMLPAACPARVQAACKVRASSMHGDRGLPCLMHACIHDMCMQVEAGRADGRDPREVQGAGGGVQMRRCISIRVSTSSLSTPKA